MLQLTATIYKYDEAGEKTGWTYINIPADAAQQLKPHNKKSFRVKGLIDDTPVAGIALVPVGEGHFILPLNGALCRQLQKGSGVTVIVKLEVDNNVILPPDDLMACLADEPVALAYFNKLPPSHRNYYTRWINETKTEATRTKRIAQAVNTLAKEGSFGQAVKGVSN